MDFDCVGLPRDPKAERIRPPKTKNNTLTLLKLLANNLEKVQKTTFSTLKMVKITTPESQNLTKISIFEVIC